MTMVWYADFVLTVQPVEVAVTKIGGLPNFTALVNWPTCLWCGRTMEFWAQIRLDEPLLSGSLYTMAYLFACPSERNPRLRQDCKEWQAGVQRNHIGQIILLQDDVSPFAPEGMATFPEYLLQFSRGEEPGESIILLTEHLDRERLDLFHEVTKLGGSPVWWHGTQAPCRPACGGPMRFIFQLLHTPDGEVSAAFHFGYGYLFLCARNCSPQGALMLCQST